MFLSLAKQYKLVGKGSEDVSKTKKCVKAELGWDQGKGNLVMVWRNEYVKWGEDRVRNYMCRAVGNKVK